MEFKFKDYKLLSQDESGEILNIRNDRKIRQVSLNSEIIDINTHQKWL